MRATFSSIFHARVLLTAVAVGVFIFAACSGPRQIVLDIPVEITSAECSNTARRDVVVDAQGMARAHIIARAGSLRIEGKPGITDVRIAAVACAPDAASLAGVVLEAERQENQVFVRTVIEDLRASLDMSIEVPDTLPLKVDDSRGDLVILNVAQLDLADGAGEIRVENVTGQASVEDGSESIVVTNVGGTLTIEDSSGDITVTGVGQDMVIDDDGADDITIIDVVGTVLIREDGGGDITIRNVGGDVIIEDDGGDGIFVSNVGGSFIVREDGGGDISASEIRGDFIVEIDGSGTITQQGVSGEIRWPRPQ